MSLNRQLWLAILLILSLAFGGAFMVSTWSAKQHLQQQLRVKNLDNATSLALSISQMPKDMVTIELLLAAQFDAGHYRLIRLTDPSGRVLVERRAEQDGDSRPAPLWFMNWVRLDVDSGHAQIQDGWKQFAALELQSHDRYAYQSLWQGERQLFMWFVILALVAGAVGSLLLRLILKPLARVVGQAEAIGERRFVTTPEPATIEFRNLVRSMNRMSGRVRLMLEQESERVDALRRETQIDHVSGLFKRESLLLVIDNLLASEGRQSTGVLVMLRLSELVKLNRDLGHEATDELLRRMGESLSEMAGAHATGWLAGRMSGSDFAVLAPGETDAAEAADLVAAAVHGVLDAPDRGAAAALFVGATRYAPGENRSALLARVDGALAAAEVSGHMEVRAAPLTAEVSVPSDLPGWRRELDAALVPERLWLERFPVLSAAGDLLHEEAPVRLRLDDATLPAGEFIAWVGRLGWMNRLDRLVIDAALARIESEGVPVAANLAPETLADAQLLANLTERLKAAPQLAKLLWLEVPEHGALHQLADFRSWCLALKPLACHIGLKHVGPGFSRIGEFHDVGIDHLKLDASLVRDIDTRVGNQAFLRGVCMVAHSVGLLALAEGVNTAAERAQLIALGFDGVTGPEIRQALR